MTGTLDIKQKLSGLLKQGLGTTHRLCRCLLRRTLCDRLDGEDGCLQAIGITLANPQLLQGRVVKYYGWVHSGKVDDCFRDCVLRVGFTAVSIRKTCGDRRRRLLAVDVLDILRDSESHRLLVLVESLTPDGVLNTFDLVLLRETVLLTIETLVLVFSDANFLLGDGRLPRESLRDDRGTSTTL